MSVTENSGCCGNRWYDKFGLLFLKASFCTVIWKRVSLSLSLSPPALSRLPRWLSFPHLEEQVHVQALLSPSALSVEKVFFHFSFGENKILNLSFI